VTIGRRVRPTALVDLAVALAALAVLAIGLEAWTRSARVPSYLMPPPSAVLARLWNDAPLLAGEASVTLGEAAAGFALGVAAAFAVATAMAQSRLLERTLFPLAILVKLTPIVAVAPLLTLWFGFGAAPKIAIAALITFFPMLVNAFVGLRSVDPQELAFLRVLAATRSEVFFRLRLPRSLPYHASGSRIAVNLALIGAVVGEWTGADRGLGRVIFVANANLDLSALFAAVIVLAAIGIAVNAAVSAIERRVLHWHPLGAAT
jgi:NitT/TauT family transport system permease protein